MGSPTKKWRSHFLVEFQQTESTAGKVLSFRILRIILVRYVCIATVICLGTNQNLMANQEECLIQQKQKKNLGLKRRLSLKKDFLKQ